MGELSRAKIKIVEAAKVAHGTFTPSTAEQTHTVTGLSFSPSHALVWASDPYVGTGAYFFRDTPTKYMTFETSTTDISNTAGTFTPTSDGFIAGSSNTAAKFYSGKTYNWVAWKE